MNSWQLVLLVSSELCPVRVPFVLEMTFRIQSGVLISLFASRELVALFWRAWFLATLPCWFPRPLLDLVRCDHRPFQ